MKMEADLSSDLCYRYSLRRSWDAGAGRCLFVMLNPSTADALQDDLTIKKCIGFAQKWSFRELEVVNLFALRATYPQRLLEVEDPVGSENDEAIRTALKRSSKIVVAWGDIPTRIGMRVAVVNQLLAAVPTHCLGRTRHGNPKHPSRIAYSTSLESWRTP
jgi:hypothetical protein